MQRFFQSCLALLLLLATAGAASADTWAILGFEPRGVAPSDADAFRELLSARLGKRTGGTVLLPDALCDGSECAREVGVSLSADRVIFGHVLALGSTTYVMTWVVDVASGNILRQLETPLQRIEELDGAATRIAQVVSSGRAVREAAPVSTVARREAPPARGSRNSHSFGVHIGGAYPTGDAWQAGGGVRLQISYMFATDHFAIEPRFGVLFDGDMADSQSYVDVPFELGAYGIFSSGDVAPFLGGGVGAHFISETREYSFQTGSVLMETHTKEIADQGWGFGAFARGGLLFLRSHAVQLAVSLEYGAVFRELHDSGFPHYFTAAASIYF